MWPYHAGSWGWWWLPAVRVCAGRWGCLHRRGRATAKTERWPHQLYFSTLHGCCFCLPLPNPASFQFPIHTFALVSPLGVFLPTPPIPFLHWTHPSVLSASSKRPRPTVSGACLLPRCSKHRSLISCWVLIFDFIYSPIRIWSDGG